MEFDLDESLNWARDQGAPQDQTACIGLLREIQDALGGIPEWAVARSAAFLGVRESFLLAIIRRIPGLRLSGTHLLEICAGPSCQKCRALAEAAEKLRAENSGFTLRAANCMRLCGKGPNIRWDGRLYSRADEALLRRLIQDL